MTTHTTHRAARMGATLGRLIAPVVGRHVLAMADMRDRDYADELALGSFADTRANREAFSWAYSVAWERQLCADGVLPAVCLAFA